VAGPSFPSDNEPMTATKPATSQGVLELHPKGFGFLRDPARHYAARPTDPYVERHLIQKFHLKQGLMVGGPTTPPPKGATGPRLAAVDRIEGAEPKLFRPRNWDELTPVDPTQWIRLETGAEPLTTRVMDLFTPIGKGQRGLIVAPPRTGKTVLLSHIANAVTTNHPDMHLIVLLVDERPEEVTEFRRTVKGQVVASSNDQDAAVHVRTAELVLERAKRLTEQGKDVFVLLDSLTRLARAYNKQTGSGGKTMSGGVDSRAMDIPKRLFGAARAFEEGGTLTILGTALIETNSRMDDVIFQEFKGTGNMELVLDRRLAEKRIYPAIDLGASGTRKEERLIPAEMLERINLLRRSLLNVRRADESMEALVKQLSKTKSNDEFLETVGKFVAK
jgi:transcription termination factor Rho